MSLRCGRVPHVLVPSDLNPASDIFQLPSGAETAVDPGTVKVDNHETE